MFKNIQKNPSCITTNIEDKLVILEFESGVYFELNIVGKIIWELIEQNKTSDEIISNLRKKFNNDSNIKNSVEKFLSDCEDKKLISFDA